MKAIEYTTYHELANKTMAAIREDIFKAYPLKCMHVYHSLDYVNAGEICLFVFVSSEHRAAATSACTVLVERIKAELPIWGKEVMEDESYHWKENR